MKIIDQVLSSTNRISRMKGGSDLCIAIANRVGISAIGVYPSTLETYTVDLQAAIQGDENGENTPFSTYLTISGSGNQVQTFTPSSSLIYQIKYTHGDDDIRVMLR